VIAPVVGLVGIGIGAAAASGGAAADSATPSTRVTVTQKATATVEVTPPPVRVTVTKSASSSQVGEDKPAGGSGDSFTMPDEIGKGLQAAQDDLQAVSGDPFYVSLSRDASGDDRFQILDSDWQVCSQNVPAGSEVTTSMIVRFGVVKLDETCP